MLLSVRASVAGAPAIGARASSAVQGARAFPAAAGVPRPRRAAPLLSPAPRQLAPRLLLPRLPAAAPAAAAAAAAAHVPVDCLLPLCAVCLVFWITSATISAAINFVLQLLGRAPQQQQQRQQQEGSGGGGSGPGLLAGIGPSRAGSSGGWVAAGVYESDIMRLPLGSYYEVPAEPSSSSSSADKAARLAEARPTASFVLPLPSSPDDWASAEAAPTPFVPANKLQVLSPGRLQAGLTTSRTRQFDDLKISLVPGEGEGEGGGGAGGFVADGTGARGLGDGPASPDDLDPGMGGGRRRPGSGGRWGPGDVPPPVPRPPSS